MAVINYETEKIPSLSPTYWYKFNETTGAALQNFGSAGVAANGVLNNTFAFNQSSLIKSSANKAIRLSAGYVSTPAAVSTGSNLIYAFPMKINAKGDTNLERRIINTGDSDGGTGNPFHRFRWRDEVLQFQVGSPNGGAVIDFLPFDGIVPGRTYHVVLAVQNNVIKAYIDGAKIKEATAGGVIHPIASRPMTIGDATGNLDLTIDDLFIAEGTFSDVDIKRLYRSFKAFDDAANDVWVSTTGTFDGSGSYTDPLDAQSGLNGGLVLTGGRIVFKNSATPYLNKFRVRVSGGSTVINPLFPYANRVRIVPESLWGVTIDAETRGFESGNLAAGVFHLDGSFLDLGFFKLTSTCPRRLLMNYISPGNSPILNPDGTTQQITGVFDEGIGNRVYHNIMYDLHGDGIDSFVASSQSEYKNNLIFNNGWYSPRDANALAESRMERNGHSIYTQNDMLKGSKLIQQNIILNMIGFPMKVGGRSASKLDNYTLVKNVMSSSGGFYDVGGNDAGAKNLHIEGEMTYKDSLIIGYDAISDADVTVKDCYLVGYEAALQILDFNRIFANNNHVTSYPTTQSATVGYRINPGYTYAQSQIFKNHYNRNSTAAWSHRYNIGGRPNMLESNFADYKAATGWDSAPAPNASTFADNGTNLNMPTVNEIRYNPTKEFLNNCGFVVVWNWQNLATVSLNLSSILDPNAQYEIRSAFNFFAGAITSGTYTGGNVTLPMTQAGGMPPMAEPYDPNNYFDAYPAVTAKPEPSPQFAVFMILPTTDAPAPPPSGNVTVHNWLNPVLG